jgi:hypothetical protein
VRFWPKNRRSVNILTAPETVSRPSGTPRRLPRYPVTTKLTRRRPMTWGKGALLWLLGIPLPIIILLALFWR